MVRKWKISKWIGHKKNMIKKSYENVGNLALTNIRIQHQN